RFKSSPGHLHDEDALISMGASFNFPLACARKCFNVKLPVVALAFHLHKPGEHHMGESTERVLAQAYELIESERLAEAEALLKPIVAAEPDNADAWWLYAHAVTDPGEARLALNNVLRIDPGYPGADDLLDSLEAEYPA